MRRRSEALLLIAAGGMAGCSTGPSHVPPLWQLPGAAISSAVSNAAYDARRAGVKRLVARHERALVAEIEAGGGPASGAALDAARVPAAERGAVLAELRDRPDIYRRRDDRDRIDVEAVTVALMVYGR